MIDMYDPPTVPTPVGGYSQAVAVRGPATLLYISGQIPETASGSVPPDFDDQCRAVWANIVAILAAADMSIQHLVKVTTYLTRREDAARNGEIRQAVLGAHRPALTVIVAQTLDPRWLLEIEAVAARDDAPKENQAARVAAEPLNAWDLDEDVPLEEIVVLPAAAVQV